MEVKIVYAEGLEIRAIRGDLLDDNDPDFLILRREEGEIRLNRRFIIKIEKAWGVGD